MSDVNTISIVVERIAYWSIGVRLWFVIQSDEGKRYQCWSLDMSSTDECLLLAKAGDTLSISYVAQKLDIQGNMKKNVITSAEFS
jgi:hypothetical protein